MSRVRVVSYHDMITSIHREINGAHPEAVRRAVTTARSLARREAAHPVVRVQYAVIADGREVFNSFAERE